MLMRVGDVGDVDVVGLPETMNAASRILSKMPHIWSGVGYVIAGLGFIVVVKHSPENLDGCHSFPRKVGGASHLSIPKLLRAR